LPYDSLEQVRARLEAVNPVFATVDTVQPAAWGTFGLDQPVDFAPFTATIDNFYQTCAISRASETMAECTRTFVAQSDESAGKTGTHG
jgi:NADH-quinone oxidoreductase subunit G